MTLTRRYPGSRPFEDCRIERLLFRGRDRENADLVQLILAHDLVLLYARSGTGKTSLINAGVLEELRRREYFPAVVRLTNSETPMETVRETVLQTAQNLGLQVEDVDATPSNLVLLLSKGKFWRGDILLTPVIILDQFEELFTLHEPPAQAKIIEALSDLAARRLPSEFDERFGQFPTMPYKIIFSVREDYLGEMETVASRIPTVMHHRFRLTPLSREQARQAISEPAKMENEELQGPSFGYTDEAIEEVVSFLARRRERDGYRQGSEVEPFQLQIICYHIESTVVRRASEGLADGGVVINVDSLGGTEGMDQILEQFYNCQIDQFPEELRERIHDLCENGLISATGKRISLEEEDIGERFGIDHNTLVRLVDLRLLRAEPRVGSTYYELTHDSLVSAVKRTGTARKPKVLLEEARYWRDSGNTALAIKSYINLSECSPKDWTAYVELATLLMSVNDPKSASKVLEAAKENDVEHKTLSLYRGLLLLDESKVPDAVSEFEKAITLDPGYVAAHLFLGDAFLRQAKREGDAEKCYRDALELDPDNDEVHTRLLNLLLDRRQFNQIEEHAEKFLDNDVFFEVLPRLTKALISNGASQNARSILSKALARPRKSFESMIKIAESAYECDLTIADEAYKTVSELNPSAPIYGKWGLVLHLLGREEEAVRKYSTALRQDPHDAAPLVNRAWSLTNLERHDEAIEDCRRALDLDVNPARPLMYWGRNLNLQGKDEDAIDKFKEALDADPGNSEILVRWARSLWNLERYDEAMDKARLAIEIDPSNAEAHLQLALSLWMSDRRAEADDRFGAASKFAPERADILRPWGELLSTMGRHHDAIDKLRRANQLDPRDARTLMIWGKCLSALGRYAESVTMCQQALDIDSSSFEAHEAHVYLAQSLAKIHKTEEAMQHFSKASTLAPDESWIYQLWAKALMDSKRYNEAEERFRRAAERATDRETITSIYEDWGYSLSRLGRHAEAEEKYRKALEIEPNSIEWRIDIAQEIAYQGRLDEARDLLLEAERLGPTTELELGNLGWGFLQIGEYETSLSYSRRALALRPDALYSRCNAGVALLQLGRPDEAKREYEQAVIIAERTAAAEDFAYHAIGDIEDALKKRPDLPGGRAVLDSLREHLDRLWELRKAESVAACG